MTRHGLNPHSLTGLLRAGWDSIYAPLCAATINQQMLKRITAGFKLIPTQRSDPAFPEIDWL